MAVKKSGKKSVSTKFAKGPDSRRGRGPRKGAPNAGRPPDEFKQLCASLASDAVASHVATLLKDPTHPHFMRAVEYATERGYGKVTQPVEHTADSTLEAILAASLTK